MHVRCPRCDEDEYLGYSLCSRCGLRFEELKVVEVADTQEPEAAETEVAPVADVECDSCKVQGLLGHRFCANCGRALEPSSVPTKS